MAIIVTKGDIKKLLNSKKIMSKFEMPSVRLLDEPKLAIKPNKIITGKI
jgi:hypothetical protein